MIKKAGSLASKHMGKFIGVVLIIGVLSIYLHMSAVRSSAIYQAESLLNEMADYAEKGDLDTAEKYAKDAAELAHRRSVEITDNVILEKLRDIEATALFHEGKIILKKVLIRYEPEKQKALQEKRTFRIPEAELGKAENILLEVIKIKPKFPEALRFLGFIAREKGSNVQAVRYLTEAVESKKDFAEALNDLGEAYYQMRQYDNAREYFEKALIADENLESANLNLGMFYFYAKDQLEEQEYSEKAAVYLKKYVELAKEKGAEPGQLAEANEMLKSLKANGGN